MEGEKITSFHQSLPSSSNFPHQTLDSLLLFSTKSKTPLQKAPLASSSARQRRSSAGTWGWLAWSTARFWRTLRAKSLRIWQGRSRKLWVLTCLLASVSSSLSSFCDLLWTDRPFCHRLAYQLFKISEILLKCPIVLGKKLPDAWGDICLSVCVDFHILDQIGSEHKQTMKFLLSCAPTLSRGDVPMPATLQQVSCSANGSWAVPLLPPAVLECVQMQVHRKHASRVYCGVKAPQVSGRLLNWILMWIKHF